MELLNRHQYSRKYRYLLNGTLNLKKKYQLVYQIDRIDK